MVKTIGLVGILCAAAIFGMTWARQHVQTTEKAPAAILQAAGTALEFAHKTSGTYAGATVEDVTLVAGDQSTIASSTAGTSSPARAGGRPPAPALGRTRTPS